MSEFVVYRTLGNGRCLVLDGTRIAGGKPDYRGNNYITSWVTNETYGPVDELKSENAKLRELLRVMAYCSQFMRDCDGCSMNDAAGIITERVGCDELLDRLRELGVEVDE